METVNFLAQLWGFSLIIIGFALLIQPRNAKHMFVVLEHETSLFFLGMVNLMVGIASLLAYHEIDSSWKVIITIISALITLRGMMLLFFPSWIKKIMVKLQGKMDLLSLALVIAIFLGCFLTYMGLTAV